MVGSARQSKIIEIITNNEIETQDELVGALRNAGFDITQATISRDIKELGLIKIVGQSKKYKYSFIDSDDKAGANKSASVFRESVIWIKCIGNLVVLKSIRGTAQLVASFVDRLSLENVMGCVYGEDTIMAIVDNAETGAKVCARLNEVKAG